MDYNKAALEMHAAHHGKLEVISKVPVKTRDDLSTAYTPGVAEPCRKICQNPDDVYTYTTKGNMVAVVTNGTAVLGLGDIGPEAGLPGAHLPGHQGPRRGHPGCGADRPQLRRRQPGGHPQP